MMCFSAQRVRPGIGAHALLIPVLVLALLLPGMATRAQEWTWLNPKPSGRTAVDVTFIDAQTGFLLNDQELFQTKDGGVTWTRKGAYDGRQLQFRGNVGAIAAQAGIYLSTNRGESWSFVWVDGAMEEDFHSVQLVGKDSVYVVGAENLYKSFDGGAHWTSQPILISAFQGGLPIARAVFTSAKVGHVAGSFGIVAKTVDGGATWRVTLPFYQQDEYIGMTFVSEQVGFVSSRYGAVLRTKDGGETWQTLYTSAIGIRTVFFVNESVGYMAGNDDTVIKTVDGGDNWTSLRYQTDLYGDTNLYGMHFFSEDRGLIVGALGRIIRTTDGGQHWSTDALTHYYINDVCFTSNTTGYIFSDKIFKTTDRGTTWSMLTEGLDGYRGFDGGYFVSDNLGFVSANGPLLRTTDGGAHWTDTGIRADGVSFVNATTGFAFSNETTLKKTVDGGISWTSIPSSYGQVHFSSELNGIRLSDGIYQTTDGGTTWTQRQSNAGADVFSDIFFVDATVGYVTAENGKVFKTVDGGASWRTLVTPQNMDYTGVTFLTRNVGMITSMYGTNFITYDGGNTWEDAGTTWPVTSVAITAEGRAYVVGAGGAVLTRALSYADAVLKVLPAKNTTATSTSVGVVAAANRKALSSLRLEYGVGNVFDTWKDLSPATVSVGNNQDYTVELTSLQANTEYQYRVRAVVGGSGQVVSDTLSFTTAPEIILETYYHETLSIDQSKIYAMVTAGGSDITNIRFEWAKDDSGVHFTPATPGTVSAGDTKQVSAVLSGLDPGIEVRVRVRVVYKGGEYVGNVYSFDTPLRYTIDMWRPDMLPEQNSVQLKASVRSNQLPISEMKYEYGLNRRFDLSVTADPADIAAKGFGTPTATVPLPYADSVYFARLRATHDGQTIYGPVEMIRRSGDPIVLTEPARDVTKTSVVLASLIAPQGPEVYDVYFEYGPTAVYGSMVQVAEFDWAPTLNLTAALTNLVPYSVIHYRVVASIQGKLYYGQDRMVRVGNVMGVDEVTHDLVRVYPNPARASVTVECGGRIEEMVVFDLLGGRQFAAAPGSGRYVLDVTGYPVGVYVLRVKTGGRVFVRKVVKE